MRGAGKGRIITAAGKPVLEINGLKVNYNGTPAVDGVDIRIKPGEIFGLLGPNGAGKTTILSAIEGLVKPDAGTVVVDGTAMRDHPQAAKQRLGVQLQTTSFQPELTISQIIRLFAGRSRICLLR